MTLVMRGSLGKQTRDTHHYKSHNSNSGSSRQYDHTNLCSPEKAFKYLHKASQILIYFFLLVI